MILQQSSISTLKPVKSLLEVLNEDQYREFLSVLSGGSIGKHLRHVIEFYECMFEGLKSGTIDYEARRRNIRIENDKLYATEIIDKIIGKLETKPEDHELKLKVTMEKDEFSVIIPTTFYRELAYNIEHCIHHLAIIKIAVLAHYKDLVLPEHFGIAYSTVRHQQMAAVGNQ